MKRNVRPKESALSYELAHPIMGTIFLVGERAKRARHSQVCSIENRVYIIIFIIIYYGTCKYFSYNP